MSVPEEKTQTLGDILSRLGFVADQAIQELGWDEDVDDRVRQAIEGLVAGPLEDEDYSGVTDAVLLWWREGDGDLADSLVDALSTLEESGFVLLMTPRTGRPGEVAASDIEDATSITGLHAHGGVAIGADWTATRLSTSRGPRR
ncbi:MAG: DUF3052 domain-containing protein [Nostocoides sp.]